MRYTTNLISVEQLNKVIEDLREKLQYLYYYTEKCCECYRVDHENYI